MYYVIQDNETGISIQETGTYQEAECVLSSACNSLEENGYKINKIYENVYTAHKPEIVIMISIRKKLELTDIL